MKPRITLSRFGVLILGVAIATISLNGAARAMAEAKPVAIIDFDYQDTSDEPTDQAADHARRLLAFMQSMRGDLARGGRYRPVTLTCDDHPCSMSQATPADLTQQASRAGARLLVFGGIHKMSTLVQWAKVEAIDVQSGKLVFDRLLTFRGDTDQAWSRAEAFIVDQITDNDGATSP